MRRNWELMGASDAAAQFARRLRGGGGGPRLEQPACGQNRGGLPGPTARGQPQPAGPTCSGVEVVLHSLMGKEMNSEYCLISDCNGRERKEQAGGRRFSAGARVDT